MLSDSISDKHSMSCFEIALPGNWRNLQIFC